MQMPIVAVNINGCFRRALVDTRCTTTIVHSTVVAERRSGSSYVIAFDGSVVQCKESGGLEITVGEVTITVDAIVVERIVKGVDVVLGLDAITQLGGVTIYNGMIKFGHVHVTATACVETISELADNNEACIIRDTDFLAKFDGEFWTVEWFWKNKKPPKLTNTIGLYNRGLEGRKKEQFEKAVDQWIEEGILMPWNGTVDNGILPLMAVEQPTKSKVRPVLDYRELNKEVECHTGDDVLDVCSETLREWRQMEGVTLVDLQSAYLQIHVDRKLWPYQLVEYKNNIYCLTRLGFGLNCAPRIMSKILKTVLEKDEHINRATNSYIDDILVDEKMVTAQKLMDHLKKFGLVTKEPEPLEGGAALGLRLKLVKGDLMFYRGNEVPVLPEILTRRELFSICGKLIGHYPVAGWLRVACSYVKRQARGTQWEDFAGEEAVTMLRDVIERVNIKDPVTGVWHVQKSNNGVIWCDASSLALGVLLEINGAIVEDAAWLRKKDDFNHINVAELEAVLKGINLALKWNLNEVELKTDSATVVGWINTIINNDKRVKTKGASEMIIKRRLGSLKDLLNEFRVTLHVTFVPTQKNKADSLTRVSKEWLTLEKNATNDFDKCCGGLDIQEVHNRHHMGVDKTLYLARKIDPSVTKADVKEVVRCCERCQSIDPAPVMHKKGEIGIAKNWSRLAIDVTHYRQIPYLTMIDCGPSRFAIWREIRCETSREIADVLNEVFLERGPVDEVLMDNSASFHSSLLKEMFDNWKINTYFRVAYRASGNGIIERNHRTVKAIAERSDITPQEAVFWYNLTPRSRDPQIIPHQELFNYEWRNPLVEPVVHHKAEEANVEIGDEVWVKPPHARCTTEWRKGHITEINSQNNVSVDGTSRHILDVRPVLRPADLMEDSNRTIREEDDNHCENNMVEQLPMRPQRNIRPPMWTTDYVMDY